MRCLLRLVLVSALVLPSVSAFMTPAEARTDPCRGGHRVDLRGKDFTKGRQLPDSLRCTDLTGAKLDGVELLQKDMTGAIFRDASLKGANLRQATVKYADFRKADLTEADLGQMYADYADFRGALMYDVDGVQAKFPRADLSGAKMARGMFGQATFTLAKLVKADLSNASLVQAGARKADFSGALMHEAKLGMSDLPNAVFDGADLREADFSSADLEGATLRGADVQDANFLMVDDLDLTGATGTPKTVPDGMVGYRPEPPAKQSPIIPDPVRPDLSPDMPDPIASAARTVDRFPFGLTLLLAGSLGLAVTMARWVAAHQRMRRSPHI